MDPPRLKNQNGVSVALQTFVHANLTRETRREGVFQWVEEESRFADAGDGFGGDVFLASKRFHFRCRQYPCRRGRICHHSFDIHLCLLARLQAKNIVIINGDMIDRPRVELSPWSLSRLLLKMAIIPNGVQATWRRLHNRDKPIEATPRTVMTQEEGSGTDGAGAASDSDAGCVKY